MSLTTTAPAASARRATSTENVSAGTGTSRGSFVVPEPTKEPRDCVTRPSTAGTSAAASSSAETGGPAFAATAPTSSISKPACASASPSRTACSGVPLRAPSNIESTVTLTIPAPSGRARSRVRSASLQRIARYGSDRADAARLRLHRSRRDPARAGQLALPRRRGRLQPGAGAGARGVPPGRCRGRDHVRPARAAGARGGAADGSDLLHLRGRLRLRDRWRDDADDRGDGAERGGHDLRADRGARDPEAAVRALRRAARVPLPVAPRPRPLPPLPRQGRRRGGERAPARPRLRGPAPARQRRDRAADADGRRSPPRLPPGPQAGQQGGGGCRPRPGPRLRPG